MDNLISAHQEKGDSNGDIVDRLISANTKADKESMSAEQMRDEIITLMLAGHETSATALAWTFHLLSENPSVENHLREELKVY